MKLSQFKDSIKNLFNLSESPELTFWASENHEGMFTAQFDTGMPNEDFDPAQAESVTNRRTIVLGVNTSETKFDKEAFMANPADTWIYRHPKSDKTNADYDATYTNLYIASTTAPKKAAFTM